MLCSLSPLCKCSFTKPTNFATRGIVHQFSSCQTYSSTMPSFLLSHIVWCSHLYNTIWGYTRAIIFFFKGYFSTAFLGNSFNTMTNLTLTSFICLMANCGYVHGRKQMIDMCVFHPTTLLFTPIQGGPRFPDLCWDDEQTSWMAPKTLLCKGINANK